MYDICFFDLDGTLTDSGPGITGAAQYALHEFGVDIPDKRELAFCVGPPIVNVLMERFGFSKEKAEATLLVYRAYYRKYCMFDNEVYPGIPELLSELKARGKTLAVATSKPTDVSEIILDHFGLLRYFDLVSGSTADGSRYEKADVIRYALDTMHADPKRVVMIGDRKYDIIGAKAFGLAAIGVTYGYGTKEELEQAGADAVVGTPKDVLPLI